MGRNGIISTDLKLTACRKFFSLEKAQQEQDDTELKSYVNHLVLEM